MSQHHRGALGALTSLTLLAALSACATDARPAVVPRATVPTPDLCKTAAAEAAAAMRAKTPRCESSGGPAGFTVRFTGTARLAGRRAPATLTVSFEPRQDAKTGEDRWQIVGRPTDDRVSLIGVGDRAVFDAKHAPQLRTVTPNVIVSVALQVTGAPVPQAELPDRLLAVARKALPAG